MKKTEKVMDDNLSIAINGVDTLIVMDTNAWLDLYFIHPVALREILAKLSEYEDIIWIPNQVWLEFERHSVEKRQGVANMYADAKKESIIALSNAKDIILQKFNNFERKNRFDGESLKQELNQDINNLVKKIREGYVGIETAYSKDFELVSNERDIVYEFVKKIYEKNKSTDFTFLEKMKICEEGAIRYKYRIAPGYTDLEKEVDNENEFWRPYGDLVLWKEILRKVQGTKTNLIFVENEKKKDWFERKGGKKLSPYLYEEYGITTDDKGIVEVCDFLGFLENYGLFLGLEESELDKLVARLKFERAILEYVEEGKEEIMSDALERYFDDSSNIYDVFYSESGCVFGGTFENIEDVELEVNLVSDVACEYDKDLGYFDLYVDVEVTGTGLLSEYVSKDVQHSGNISFSITGKCIANLAIKYDKISGDVSDGYDICTTEFDDCSFEVFSDDFDININLDD